MSRHIVKEILLSNSGYWVLNKTLVKKLGLECAFLLTNFAEAEQLMGDENGWFYQTIDTVEELTTLSRYKQDNCLEKMAEYELYESETRGLPRKRYFRLNYDKIAVLLENKPTEQYVRNSQTSVGETRIQECKKLTTNKEHTNKELNNKEKDSAFSKIETNKELEDTNQYEDNFERMWKLYPSKKGKGSISKTKKKEIYKLGDEFERCISRYIEDVKRQRQNGFASLRYKNGSTFFNSGYKDYLDKNYKELDKKEEVTNAKDEEGNELVF